MNVTAILATCGRHTLLERSVGMFLEQDYKGDHTLLIFNNSDVPIRLIDENRNFKEQSGIEEMNIVVNHISDNKHIRLVNQPYSITGGVRSPYTNLGSIYENSLKWLTNDTDIIVHWDDDDLFLPNHLSEGVRGLIRGKQKTLLDQKAVSSVKAYKPAKSYYRHPGGIQLMSNTLEPSIFVEASHIKEHGYSLTTTDQHLQWVNPLVYGGNIFVDNEGPATLIYNWGDTDIPTFKTSGDAGNPGNFDNYRRSSQDHGDKVLTPWTREQLQPYYNLVNG